MQFLNPFALFGLIASTIPIIIHLLNLRKIKTIEFSTLKFLNELQKSSIKRIKIKQIILLIIRTLLIIFLILSFARPSVKSHLPILGSYSKTSVVILLDNSYSMDVSDELGNRFIQAKTIAKSLIRNLKDGDEAAIILLSPEDQNYSEVLTRNLKVVDENLDKVAINNYSGNYLNSLSKIQSIFEKSKNLIKEVYIVSDFQKNNFATNVDSLKLFDVNTSIYLIPVGGNSKTEIQNLSLDSLSINSSIIQLNKSAEIGFSVKNNSTKKYNGSVVNNYINNIKIAQRSFDINEQETKFLNISSIPNSTGLNQGYIELENDALEQDNKRYYGYIVPEKPKSAIIGNENSIKFLRIILNLDENNANSTEVLSNKEISSVDLSKYDVVYFTGPYSKSDFKLIKQYSDNGGGVFIFPNKETDPNYFKSGLSEIGITISDYFSNQDISISKVDKMHPLFANVFKNPADEKLQIESPRFINFFQIQNGSSIIKIDKGSILSDFKSKNGKILILGTTPDNIWSNISNTSIFPTIIYRSLYYLNSKESKNINITPKYSNIIEIPSKLTNNGKFRILNPDKSETFIDAALIAEKYLLEVTNLNKFGNYIVYNSINEVVAILSVNPDKEESKINNYSSIETKKLIGELSNSEVKIEEIKDHTDIAKAVSRAKSGTELWQIFVILSILMALAELLVQRLYKSE